MLTAILKSGGGKKCDVKFFYKRKKGLMAPYLIFCVSLVCFALPTLDKLSTPWDTLVPLTSCAYILIVYVYLIGCW